MKIGFIAFVFFVLLGHLARADQYDYLNGTFDMKIKIGETEFIDVLEIKAHTQDIQRALLSGQVTVPGVFTAPLSGEARYGLWVRTVTFQFSITAIENGKEFKVYYRGEIVAGEPAKLEGSAFLDGEKLLGHFTAVKRK